MTPEVKAKKEPLPYSAQQRAQAVLSIWTERRRPAEVCQELGIRPAVLAQWEKRALAAMLKGLESHARLEPGPALSPNWSGHWMTRSWSDSPAANCIGIKCRISPPGISSRPGWEIGRWEKPWPFAWSNGSYGMDRRSCSNATTGPISIIRRSMSC